MEDFSASSSAILSADKLSEKIQSLKDIGWNAMPLAPYANQRGPEEMQVNRWYERLMVRRPVSARAMGTTHE